VPEHCVLECIDGIRSLKSGLDTPVETQQRHNNVIVNSTVVLSALNRNHHVFAEARSLSNRWRYGTMSGMTNKDRSEVVPPEARIKATNRAAEILIGGKRRAA